MQREIMEGEFLDNEILYDGMKNLRNMQELKSEKDLLSED